MSTDALIETLKASHTGYRHAAKIETLGDPAEIKKTIRQAWEESRPVCFHNGYVWWPESREDAQHCAEALDAWHNEVTRYNWGFYEGLDEEFGVIESFKYGPLHRKRWAENNGEGA